MTETDKLDEMARDFCKVGPKPKSEVRRRILAYGAAQYEAGAAIERKRAKAKVVGHHRFSHDGPCPKNCYYETAD